MFSCAKAEANSVGPRLKLGDLEGFRTLQCAREVVRAALTSGASNDGIAQQLEVRLVSPDVPPSLLFDPKTPVYGSFRSLYQGDHLGVEFATEAHTMPS